MSVISRDQWRNHFMSLGKTNKETVHGRYSIGVVNQSGSGSIIHQTGAGVPLETPTIPSLPTVQRKKKVRTVKLKTGGKTKKSSTSKRSTNKKKKSKTSHNSKSRRAVKKGGGKKSTKTSGKKNKPKKTLF